MNIRIYFAVGSEAKGGLVIVSQDEHVSYLAAKKDERQSLQLEAALAFLPFGNYTVLIYDIKSNGLLAANPKEAVLTAATVIKGSAFREGIQ